MMVTEDLIIDISAEEEATQPSTSRGLTVTQTTRAHGIII